MVVHFTMADSTLSCFTSLLEYVPGWIAELEDILKSAAVEQEEIMFVNSPPSPPRTDSKTWSIRSRRSRQGYDRVESPIQLNSMRPTLPHLATSDALRVPQKKRKNASILSDGDSGPVASRAKMAPVVYYDGNTQKRFEKLVRAIGLSRNAIRKGKMSAKVESLSRTGSSSSDRSLSGGEDLNIRRLDYKSTRPSPPPAFGRNDDSEAFDSVDGKLEKAQGFCESAAYQVLKDGDCTLEVSHAKEHFAEALRITEAELPGLQKKADEAVERQRRRQADDEMKSRRTATALALKARLQATATVQSVVPSESSSLEIDLLEADATDDESESDGEFNVTSLQFGKLPQMRPMRLTTAH